MNYIDVMKQTLEVLKKCSEHLTRLGYSANRADKAIPDLCAAIEQAEKQEPVAQLGDGVFWCGTCKSVQEATHHTNPNDRDVWCKGEARWLQGPFYTAPLAAQTAPMLEPLMVDMQPPATQRDHWMYEQGRLAERDPRSHAAQTAPAHDFEGLAAELFAVAQQSPKDDGFSDTIDRVENWLREHFTSHAELQSKQELIAWQEAEAISNLPAVDEAIRALLNDQTADNATAVVLAILKQGAGSSAASIIRVK